MKNDKCVDRIQSAELANTGVVCSLLVIHVCFDIGDTEHAYVHWDPAFLLLQYLSADCLLYNQVHVGVNLLTQNHYRGHCCDSSRGSRKSTKVVVTGGGGAVGGTAISMESWSCC